jgi:hypothetical protein
LTLFNGRHQSGLLQNQITGTARVIFLWAKGEWGSGFRFNHLSQVKKKSISKDLRSIFGNWGEGGQLSACLPGVIEMLLILTITNKQNNTNYLANRLNSKAGK